MDGYFKDKHKLHKSAMITQRLQSVNICNLNWNGKSQKNIICLWNGTKGNTSSWFYIAAMYEAPFCYLFCISWYHKIVFSSPEPKARVSYCHSAPSVVRPSVRPSVVVVVRKLLTFSTSSPKPLDGFWWNLVGMKYSWFFTSVVVFRPDPPRGGSRAGQNRSRGSPSSRNFFFRPECYSDKPNS